MTFWAFLWNLLLCFTAPRPCFLCHLLYFSRASEEKIDLCNASSSLFRKLELLREGLKKYIFFALFGNRSPVGFLTFLRPSFWKEMFFWERKVPWYESKEGEDLANVTTTRHDSSSTDDASMLTDCDDDDGVKDISGLRSCSAHPPLTPPHFTTSSRSWLTLWIIKLILSAARKEY